MTISINLKGLSLLFLIFLFSCSNKSVLEPEKNVANESIDTVFFHDTILMIDTLYIQDTVLVIDTINIYSPPDSFYVYIIDTIYIDQTPIIGFANVTGFILSATVNGSAQNPLQSTSFSIRLQNFGNAVAQNIVIVLNLGDGTIERFIKSRPMPGNYNRFPESIAGCGKIELYYISLYGYHKNAFIHSIEFTSGGYQDCSN